MTADDDSSDSKELRLGQFLKRNGVSGTGGQAKLMIQSGLVKVNGEVETRRRKKLAVGDVIEVNGKRLVVKDCHGSV